MYATETLGYLTCMSEIPRHSGIFNIIIVVLECISGINILSRQSIHVAVKDRNGDTRFVIIYNRIKIFYSAHMIGL